MSLINYAGDPTLKDLTGVEDKARGETARFRELHFGIANLMPDSAYFQTIKDWAQLINLADQSLQIHLHYLNLEGVERHGEAAAHAQAYGKRVEVALEAGLDALIVTGANTEHDFETLRDVPYAKDFKRLVAAIESGPVTSGLFSCFAFHTLLETKFGVQRTLGIPEREDEKNWGVIPHFVPQPARQHFLTRGGDTHFDGISSRWGDISAEQATEAGFLVLNQADNVRQSVGAATDSKMNFVGLQTHSEYESLGLLKEYLRDWNLYQAGTLSEPVFPTFLTETGIKKLKEFTSRGASNSTQRKLFYTEIEPEVRVTWKAPGTAFIHRWVSGVLKLTSYDRHKKYMNGVDPENPLKFLDSQT